VIDLSSRQLFTSPWLTYNHHGTFGTTRLQELLRDFCEIADSPNSSKNHYFYDLLTSSLRSNSCRGISYLKL